MDAERWLSQPRLQVYLNHAGGDLPLALDLYLWNSTLAGAAMSDACHLEVALRNAYDAELSKLFPNWAVDRASALFTRTQGVPRAVALQRRLNDGSVKSLDDVRRNMSIHASHGQILAGLSFGFWTKLTEKDRTPTFWTPMLHHVFPAGTARPDVHDLVVRINRFRNRLAHNEPVFSTRTGLRDRLGDVEALFTLVNPAAATFVKQHSSVAAIMARSPVAGLV